MCLLATWILEVNTMWYVVCPGPCSAHRHIRGDPTLVSHKATTTQVFYSLPFPSIMGGRYTISIVNIAPCMLS